MALNQPLCYRFVDGENVCRFCGSRCIKNGKSKGLQRYQCTVCRKNFQAAYRYQACAPGITDWIIRLTCESCGIRSIARLLKISPVTVLKRIIRAAKGIVKPMIAFGQEYELDEMRTYIGNKTKLIWIAYALRKDTKEVIDFAIGSRTNKTLRLVTDTLLLSAAVKVYTDKLVNYAWLLPKGIHDTSYHGTNTIERKNLSLRTHLKRLCRKTICYTRSRHLLAACLKLYFWY